MPKKNIHVARHQEKWAVVKEGVKKPLGLFKTQTVAIKRARPIAKKDKVELVIHNKKNVIRDKDSYGDDPCPPKDKKF
ncbi:DUF2188 domain-containing protein [Patescibacteria group bacterium]|nr:DUF2188 domain-containing protein [Patescibacteria group bacterium]